MMNIMKRLFIATLFTTFFFSCIEDDDINVEVVEALPYNITISNAGNYNATNASVSILTQTNGIVDSIQNAIFESVNGVSLGDVLQSIAVNDNYMFLAVNNSHKIEVVDRVTFKSVKTISINSPRYMTIIDDTKAYISAWGSTNTGDEVSILDLESLTITGTISTGESGPEAMLLVDDFLYVTHSGGHGSSEAVTIINTNADTVYKQLTAYVAPSAIIQDANETIWVNCRGAYTQDWSSVTMAMIKIDPTTQEITDTIELGTSTEATVRLLKDNTGQTLYYKKGDGIYSLDISTSTVNESPLISGSFYGLGIDPANGNILTGAYNFTSSENSASIYNKSGELISTFDAGIAPSEFYFFE